ncbi:MAG: hypothetical protein ISR65_15845 [Bacteriovoracaceae bacterium]|nr:hypothetical protein [Bacteriovoracaceae bacterium]
MQKITLWCAKRCSIISNRSLLIQSGIFVSIMLVTYFLNMTVDKTVLAFWTMTIFLELTTALYLLFIIKLKRSRSEQKRTNFFIRRFLRMTIYIWYAAFMPFTTVALITFVIASVIEMVDFTIQGFLVKSEEIGQYSKRGIVAFTATLILACFVGYYGYFANSVSISKLGSLIIIFVMYWDLYLLLPHIIKMTSYYTHHLITAQAAAIALFSSDSYMPPFVALLGAFLLTGAIVTRIRRIYRKKMKWDYLGPMIVIINATDYILAGISIYHFPFFVKIFGGSMSLLLVSLFIIRIYVNWGLGSSIKERIIAFSCLKIEHDKASKKSDFSIDATVSDAA